MGRSRWLIPEVYPLIGAMTLVGGLVVFSLARHATMNPAVRFSKDGRKDAMLDTSEEGRRYVENGFRGYLRTQSPQVFARVNRFFSDPDKTS